MPLKIINGEPVYTGDFTITYSELVRLGLDTPPQRAKRKKDAGLYRSKPVTSRDVDLLPEQAR